MMVLGHLFYIKGRINLLLLNITKIKEPIDKKLVDLFHVLSANLLSLISGIVTTFFIPNHLIFTEYGFWQLFCFYANYVGFFQFGFTDGIYLKFGKFDYDDLPKEKFRTYFGFFLIAQLTISMILILFAILFTQKPEMKLIFIYVSINSTLISLSTFLIFINQITKRFKIFFLSTGFSKLVFVLLALLIISLNLKRYYDFIFLQTIVNFSILLYLIIKSPDLVFGKGTDFRSSLKDISECIAIGFSVMIGNFIAILIIGTSRFFIYKFFTIKDFAIYSFAIALLSIIFIIINSLSTVAYPYLARIENNQKALYEKMQKLMLFIMSVSLVGFFIIRLILVNFLPKYACSLDITMVLFPTALFKAQIDIVAGNFYKVFGLIKEYVINNLIIFSLGIILTLASLYIYKNPFSIALGSLILFYLWLLYSDLFFKKLIQITFFKIHLVQLLIVALFFIIATEFSSFSGTIIYMFGCVLILFSFYKSDLQSFYKTFIHKKKSDSSCIY
jgi:O-antigen/teichoic acid export membrane protein